MIADLANAPNAIGELRVQRKYVGEAGPAQRRAFGLTETDVLAEGPLLAAIALHRERGTRALLVTLESEGGSVETAFALYDALYELSAAGGIVIVHCVGWCASTATVLALAGDLIVMDEAAKLGGHSMRGPQAAQ